MITLVLGGTRSGKSVTAEAIAGAHGKAVTYIATAALDPTDDEHQTRIAVHRSRRPSHWTTVECTNPTDLPEALRDLAGVALVDSLGTWVTLHRDLIIDSTDLLDALACSTEPVVIVSEEVGLAVHPPNELGRRYVDVMGTLNQQVAEVADRVLFVVAGRAIELPPPSSTPGSGSKSGSGSGPGSGAP